MTFPFKTHMYIYDHTSISEENDHQHHYLPFSSFGISFSYVRIASQLLFILCKSVIMQYLHSPSNTTICLIMLLCYYVYSRYPLIEFTFLPLTILFNLSDKDLHRIKQNIWKCCHVIFFNWIRVSWSFTNQTSFPLWSWNTHYFDVLFFFLHAFCLYYMAWAFFQKTVHDLQDRIGDRLLTNKTLNG